MPFRYVVANTSKVGNIGKRLTVGTKLGNECVSVAMVPKTVLERLGWRQRAWPGFPGSMPRVFTWVSARFTGANDDPRSVLAITPLVLVAR